MATDNILDQFKSDQKVKEIDASKKLKIGFIGTGMISHSHMKQYMMMPDVEVVAAADLVPNRAEKFFEKWEVKGRAYTDYKEMLEKEELDAVSVCTYNMTHAECAIAALEKGIHVLLEKPMCVTMEQAEAIMKAEKKSGKILSMGFQPRMNPNMKEIKKIVESGVLGKVYYIQTGGGRRRGIPAGSDREDSLIKYDTSGVGALGDIGCYSLDMVLNAIGYPKPLTVSGYKSDFFGKNPKYTRYVKENHQFYAERFGVDDFAAAFIRLEGDIILDFRIAWAMNINTPGDTIILGTEGGLRIPSTDCWNGNIGGPMTLYHEVAGEQVETTIPMLPPTAEGDVYHKVRSFLDAIKEGGKAPVPTSQILYNQAILCGIVDSANAGREVEIKIPEI